MWGVLQMSFMKLPKVILFDLDGVILDTETVYLELLTNYSNRIGMPIAKELYINNFLGMTRRDIDNYYKEKYKDKYDSEKYWNELNKYRKEYLLNNKIRIKNGFLDLKEYLNENNFYTGIVTSNSLEQTKELFNNTKLNLKDFDSIITRDDVLNTKPNPELYLKAIEKFGFNEYDYLTIEDSNVGITSALRANINVINVEDLDIIKPELKEKCLKRVKSLYEVKDYLKEMK